MEEATNIRHELAYQLESIPAEQIKQAVIKWLDEEREEVPKSLQSFITSSTVSNENSEASFSETAPYEEWLKEFRRLIEYGENLPILSDEDISRESMYPDRF